MTCNNNFHLQYLCILRELVHNNIPTEYGFSLTGFSMIKLVERHMQGDTGDLFSCFGDQLKFYNDL